MPAKTADQCQHPSCTCEAAAEGYCSPQCQQAAKSDTAECQCDHPGCQGRASIAA